MNRQQRERREILKAGGLPAALMLAAEAARRSKIPRWAMQIPPGPVKYEGGGSASDWIPRTTLLRKPKQRRSRP